MEKIENKYISFEEVTMETSNMKNMVVLKNLPSNLVEEAIVILKSNKKVKKLEKIEKSLNNSQEKMPREEKDYIIKEAEMIVSQYISKIEKKEQKEVFNKTIKKKYKNLKKYAYLATGVCILQMLLLMIK